MFKKSDFLGILGKFTFCAIAVAVYQETSVT